VRAWRKSFRPDVTILAYHRVLPATMSGRSDFDPELVSAWSDEFNWQMSYLKRHCEVMTCEELSSALGTSTGVPKNTVVITFDDGFKDNFLVAFPILKHHGLRATFFICTDNVESGERLWFDRIATQIGQWKSGPITLPGYRIEFEATELSRKSATDRFLNHLKRVPNLERVNLCQALFDLIPEGDSKVNSLHLPMHWDELREMAKAGMEIGSHSKTHPILSQVLEDRELHAEIHGSKEVIEKALGHAVTSFAYPVGKRFSFDARTINMVERAGYRFAVTYEAGINTLPVASRHALKRISVERYISRDMFSASILAPDIMLFPHHRNNPDRSSL
jgi:peptidoglycan/xylan/chitin deacetylase (PgdA/CDA1 family)